MNELTPEVLAMYEKLQPKFREAMGPLQLKDFRMCLKDDSYLVIQACMFCEYKEIASECDCLLRLPLPIDDRNPGRGLVGMIKNFNGFILLHSTGKWIVWRGDIAYEGTTPTEALLRALMHQEVK